MIYVIGKQICEGVVAVKCPFCGIEHLHSDFGERQSHCAANTLCKTYMIVSGDDDRTPKADADS